MKGSPVKMVMTARDLLPVFELKTMDNCHTMRGLVDFDVELPDSMLEMIMACDEAMNIRTTSVNMSKLVYATRWDIWVYEGNSILTDKNREFEPAPLSPNPSLRYSIALGFERPVYLCNVFNEQALRL